MNWQESATKPGEVYYIPDPTHAAVFLTLGVDGETTWHLSCSMLCLRDMNLRTKDADEAKRKAESLLQENADRLQKKLNALFQLLGPAEECEELTCQE